LGEWYWNHSVQKSCKSFNELLNIVGCQNFHREDVRHEKWGRIDAVLAKNDFDKSMHGISNSSGLDIIDEDEDAKWIDEDEGWKKTLISISVPSHHRLKDPGPKECW
jgi:hypothetical protein